MMNRLAITVIKIKIYSSFFQRQIIDFSSVSPDKNNVHHIKLHKLHSVSNNYIAHFAASKTTLEQLGLSEVPITYHRFKKNTSKLHASTKTS